MGQWGEAAVRWKATLLRNKKWVAFTLAILAVVALLAAGPPIHEAASNLEPNQPGTSAEIIDTLNSGHTIPRLGWGSFNSKGRESTNAVVDAVNAGFRHIDTAEIYGNEAALGAGLQQVFKDGKVNRTDLFITSKLFDNHHAAADVLPTVQKSLSDLQLEYLDLYLVHWPCTKQTGEILTPPLTETWAAMESLVDQGLVRSIGVSNFSPEKIQTVLDSARIQPAVNQVEIHPFFRNDRVVEWCKEQGIHVTGYAPLSSPQTMKKDGRDMPNLLQDELVGSIAAKHRRTPAQVLLRWGLQHHNSVIPKSSKAKHSVENQGVWGWELPREDFEALSSMDFQSKYFAGTENLSEEGPYYTYDDLWNEPAPSTQIPQ